MRTREQNRQIKNIGAASVPKMSKAFFYSDPYKVHTYKYPEVTMQ